MKRIILLGFLAVGLIGPVTAADMRKKSPEELLRILQSRGLLAKPYYNGVPDPVGRSYGAKKKPTRKDILNKLAKINIPLANAYGEWSRNGGATMEQVLKDFATLIANANNGERINFFINPYMQTGGTANTGSGVNPMGPGGLPMGMGGGAFGPLGGPFGPVGGVPGGGLGPGAGAPLLGPNGLPAAPVGPGAGLGGPGQAAQLFGPNGFPAPPGGSGAGLGGGPISVGSNNPGAFSATQVKLQGFPTRIQNINALDLMDIIVRSFDHPKGIQYNILPYGIIFTERSPNNTDPISGAPLFTRKLYINPNTFGTQTLPNSGTTSSPFTSSTPRP